MRKAVHSALVISSIILAPLLSARACTTAVVSGKATADGRPLLWKNRDFSVRDNEVVYIQKEGKYPCLGLVNAKSRSSIWMGVNRVGLCIENSVTRDLAHPAKVKGLGNGGFMLLALQTCATVDEVEELLKQTNETGRSTCANFGVIDAQGGAVFFETSHNNYRKFDANDPKTAPLGFIVRSNFSITGKDLPDQPTAEDLKEIYSGERYLRANSLLTRERDSKISMKYLLRNLSRDLSCEGDECPGAVNSPAGTLPDFVATANTISRTTTVSYGVFQGVKKGEDPLLTTMWLGLGDPKFSVSIPCWVATEMTSDELHGKTGGPLGQKAIALRDNFFDKDRNGVRTEGLPEIWSRIWTFEDQTIQNVEKQLAIWREKGINPDSMKAIHVSTAEQALALMDELVQEHVAAPLTTSSASGNSDIKSDEVTAPAGTN